MEVELKVSDVMKKNVIVIPAGAPVVEAARLMKKNNIGSVIVIKGSEATGIVTERDIVRKVVAENKPNTVEVNEVMSSPLIVVGPEVDIREASLIMKKHSIKRLPVIDSKGYVVGIITEDDILKVLPGLVDLLEEKAMLGH